MVSGWQEAAAQHAEEVSAKLRQLLTSGLGLLRTELGVELGLQPQLYPSWVFLAVPAFLALLLLLLLLHCASARGSPARKAGTHEESEPAVHLTKAPAVSTKNVRAEEPKKKNKKKPAEKAKPNGRPVELAEEVIAPVKKESPKQPPDADKKNEKVKKNKKKPKVDVKQTQQSPSQDKKEAEEGNWETKISNKEKRQQRKRDKGTDSELLPETTTVTESFTMVPSQPTNIRKSKGPSEVSAVNGGGWNEKPAKIPSQVVEEKWVPPVAAAGKKKVEPCTWNQDAVDSNGKDWSAPWSERSIFPGIAPWTPVEARISSSEQRPAPFSTIGLNSSVSASVSDPVPQPGASDNQWEASPNEPSIDDEWSGLNGISSADPSSDWNAPAEEWGNYGEEEPAPAPQIEDAEQEVPKVSDDDKEKEETTGQTSASSKTKKKKKKKKKQGEESGSPTQETEGTREALDDYKEDSTPSPPPVIIPSIIGKSNEHKETLKETRVHAAFTESSVSAMHNISEKSPSLAQQAPEASTAATKQNIAPPPSQVKSEESWESPKQVKKKKKARRET